jgi:hypothetical protein
MKTRFLSLTNVMIVAMIMISGTAIAQNKGKKEKAPKAAAKSESIRLFNGKDLNNWVFHLKDPSVDPVTVFTIKDGVIHIKGDPFGYMRTKETYSDYNLHVEWRYPSELTNSGVFIHAQQPDTIWLKCFECQLKSGNAGDFVLMNGADMNRTDKSGKVVRKLTESNEKPVGEWNSLDVRCLGNTIEVSVNGTPQNKGTGLNVSKGSICLQSEGKDVEFRNVVLTKLKK